MKNIYIINSVEELKELADKLAKEEEEDNKHSTEKYDNFIFSMFNFVRSIADDGNFNKDSVAYEHHIAHNYSLRDKRNFYETFYPYCKELVNDIMELTAEYVLTHVTHEENGKESKVSKKK